MSQVGPKPYVTKDLELLFGLPNADIILVYATLPGLLGGAGDGTLDLVHASQTFQPSHVLLWLYICFCFFFCFPVGWVFFVLFFVFETGVSL